MTIKGHPASRLDWRASWNVIERGEGGVLYYVPDSDSDEESLQVVDYWVSDKSATLGTVFLEEAREILENPQWGWSVSCWLPEEQWIAQASKVVGSAPADWVRALLGVLAAKPWIKPETLARLGRDVLTSADEVDTFLRSLSAGTTGTLTADHLEWIRRAYKDAVQSDG